LALERAGELVPGVRRAAAVAVGQAGAGSPGVGAGVGPRFAGKETRAGRAPVGLARGGRQGVLEQAGVEVSAVLMVGGHPTDVRHNSKIDRPVLATWARKVLAGKKARVGKGVIAW